GVSGKPHWVRHGNFSPSSGYEMMAQLCAELGRPPKALFTAACGLLEGVLRYLNQHQLMAADIHLCSFDDHYLFDCLPLRIDTIAQDCPAMAGRAFDLLRQLIEQETVDQSGLLLPAQIHWRHPASRQRKL
ncbi:MAG: substrate-binding domain-containing protein, partial [Aeromonadaceae bacterium]|nr:substrate-binding domain-containing protein [Aeromonadaceae bacterium]